MAEEIAAAPPVATVTEETVHSEVVTQTPPTSNVESVSERVVTDTTTREIPITPVIPAEVLEWQTKTETTINNQSTALQNLTAIQAAHTETLARMESALLLLNQTQQPSPIVLDSAPIALPVVPAAAPENAAPNPQESEREREIPRRKIRKI